MSGAKRVIWQVTSSKSWGGRESLPVDLHFAFVERELIARLFCAQNSAIAVRHGTKSGITSLPFSGKFDGKTLRALRTNLAADCPDIILSHYSYDLFMLRRLLQRKSGPKLVLTKHVGPGKPKKDFIHRWIYRRVNLVLGVSDYIARRCREVYPVPGRRVSTWYPGVATRRLEFSPDARNRIRRNYGLTENDLLIGYVARLTPGKGHRDLISAFLSLAATRDNLFLVLPGSASPDEQAFAAELQELAQAAPEGKRVMLPGFVEGVFDLLAACDIFANPSPREAFGLNTVEALALGLPVVGTTGGGTPEIITDGVNGLLVEPRNPEQLSAALSRLIENADLRRRLGRAAQRAFTARFTMEQSANRLLENVFQLLPR